MSTAETIILTAVINLIITGLVGGIVIYRIQKKIDSSFQKSLFEHQTRFSRNYTRKVEILGTLYQKYLVFADTIHQMIHESVKSPEELGAASKSHYIVNKQDETTEQINDFWHYHQFHRLDLTDAQAEEITQILNRSLRLQNAALMFAGSPVKRDTPLPNWWLAAFDDLLDLKTDEKETMNVDEVLSEVSRGLERQTRNIERLYKSVAETNR
jgi:hypothetical protein